jgi:nucleoporin NUP42
MESMTKDITPLQDKPLWPLSSYGAAKYEPIVIGGLDESLEELRVKAVTALKAGTINEYVCSQMLEPVLH